MIPEHYARIAGRIIDADIQFKYEIPELLFGDEVTGAGSCDARAYDGPAIDSVSGIAGHFFPAVECFAVKKGGPPLFLCHQTGTGKK